MKATPMRRNALTLLMLLGAAALLAAYSMAPTHERPLAPNAGDWPRLCLSRSLAGLSPAVSTALQMVAAADIEWQSFSATPGCGS